MSNRVYNHLDSKGLLHEKQFGFQRNNSTEHAILQFIRDITDCFENWGIYTRSLYRCFWNIRHSRSSHFNQNYLSNRKQYISSQDVPENCLDIICNLPQGSIFGPLLFLVYVDELFKASSPLIEVMFADDTNLFLSHKNIDTPFASKNVQLENIHIKRDNVTKLLGVFIHENLVWKQHTDIVRSKISKSIGILYKWKDVLSKKCLK